MKGRDSGGWGAGGAALAAALTLLAGCVSAHSARPTQGTARNAEPAATSTKAAAEGAAPPTESVTLAPEPATPSETLVSNTPGPTDLQRIDLIPQPSPAQLADLLRAADPVTIEARSVHLSKLLALFSAASGREIRLGEGLDSVLSISFHQLPLHEALDQLLANRGLVARRNGKYLLIALPALATTAFLLPPATTPSWPGRSAWPEAEAALRALLSERGQLQATPGGAAFVIQDLPERIDLAEGVLRELVALRQH